MGRRFTKPEAWCSDRYFTLRFLKPQRATRLRAIRVSGTNRADVSLIAPAAYLVVYNTRLRNILLSLIHSRRTRVTRDERLFRCAVDVVNPAKIVRLPALSGILLSIYVFCAACTETSSIVFTNPASYSMAVTVTALSVLWALDISLSLSFSLSLSLSLSLSHFLLLCSRQ